MRVVTTYRVFIAAPSDMSAEVDFAIGLVSDVNCLAEPLGFKFETFYWLENATPGVDEEAQARIDKQGAGYDVLLSMMGSKIGSPTKNHASGTIGEIESAIEKYTESFFKNDSVIALFKEVLVGVKSPNLSDILKVQEFRDSLAKRGVLYHDFSDDDDLKETLFSSFGLLFARHVREGERQYSGRSDDRSGTSTFTLESDGEDMQVTSSEDTSLVVDPELGILDLGDVAAENFARAQLEIEVIGNIVRNLGENLPAYTKQMEDLTEAGDVARAKKVISSVAKEIDNCAALLEDRDLSIPELVSDAFSELAQILEMREADFGSDDTDVGDLGMAETAASLAVSIEEATSSFVGMRESLWLTPRMTKELNLAKRRLLSILDKIISMQEETLREVRLAEAYFSAKRPN